MILLKADQVTKRFGGLTAVSKLDFELEEGSIASVIGPNGAGKTTFFNCLTGFFQVDEGTITFQGDPIHRLRPDEVAHYGISRTYQNIRLFGSMTALENILVGQHNHLSSTWLGAILHTRGQQREEKAAEVEAQRLLDFVGLKGRGDHLAVKLPYGDQRRLEIARALANKPRLLLLDEPTAGMNPSESLGMTDFFRKLRGELGITVLLIEHEMRVVMGISDRVTVLDYGQKIAEGTPKEIQQNPRVIEAYLGRDGAEAVAAEAASAGTPTMAARMGRSPVSDMATPLLSVQDVNTYYGSIHALRGISLEVRQGEIVALIGGNGAGKSTTLNTISGLVRPRSGQVRLEGEDLAGYQGHEIMARGIVQVPEGRRIFARLTVRENLKMGAYIVTDKAAITQRIDAAFEMFPRLKQRENQVAGTLSGGEQQMLAMTRALMSNPKVLLLDEPSMGLAPNLVDQIFDTISDLHVRGTTILLVEQNARKALQIADRGYVIETGKIVLAQDAAELRENEMVQKAYLGID